ncbi:MAG TPA: YhdP family protein [Rhodocyclaceae bacterium]|nr:YhdP family protein [Rhodocyclaceae bacterium]
MQFILRGGIFVVPAQMFKKSIKRSKPDSPPSKQPAPQHRWAWWRRALAAGAFMLFAVPRTFWRVMLAGYFVLAIVWLLLRYVAAPQIVEHRADIVAALSHALGLKVEVATLQVDWNGLRPALHLAGFRLFDHQGRPALALPRVDASIAWSSLLHGHLELHELDIQQPELMMRRDASGAIFVAGLQVNGKGPDSGFSDWILHQHEISISDARLNWRDEQRAAPALQLDRVSFRLENSGDSHRFAVVADPPAAYAAKLDIRGDLRGEHLAQIENWRGSIYLATDRADLAVWQHWVSYPLELPRGNGSVHAWLNFEGEQIAGLTVDVALSDVAVRFAKDLPMLELTSLSGRIAMATRAANTANEFTVSAERLQCVARDGLQLVPANFSLHRVAAMKGQPAHGEVSGEHLDTRALAQLAIYLPMPDALRQRLVQAEPRGRITKLMASWQEKAPSAAHDNEQSAAPDIAYQLAQFKIDADVDALSMNAQGNIPGFDSLSGTMTGTERSGQLNLHIKQGGLYLPAVMSTPRIPLDQMDVRASWSHESGDAGRLQVQLQQLAISNEDVSAELSGNWRAASMPSTASISEASAGASAPISSTATRQALGTIDLTGRIKRAHIGAVWRYTPLILEAGVTHWLEQGLHSGTVEDGHLRLAGDLDHFPFRDGTENNGKGIFRVDGHFRDAEIEYASRWPALNGVAGELLFEGSRMQISADSGHYGGAQVNNVKIEIPDLILAGAQVLSVNGHASGPTADFLSYVGASPLANTSGHITDNMQAQGNGQLDLHLQVPLHDSIHTQVTGAYRFANNQIRLLPSLPEFRNATGRMEFNEHLVNVPELNAEFIGGRLRAKGVNEADGALRIDVNGNVPAKGLPQLLNNPAWSHLTGETLANATVRIRKQRIELTVGSRLVGITSNLPAPFAKSAAEPLPFLFGWQLVRSETAPDSGEDAVQDATADQADDVAQNWHVQLGKRADAQWQDHCDGKICQFQRGALAINDAINLPDRGLRISGHFDKLNLDAWKPIVLASVGAASNDDNDMTVNAAMQMDEAIAVGHSFRNVTARASRRDQRWLLRLDGPDIAGDMAWFSEGRGRLRARLSELALRPVKNDAAVASLADTEAQESLPALDVTADKFSMQDIALGRLELQASNQGNSQADAWHLDHISIESSDSKLSGDGLWRPFGPNRSMTLNFLLDTHDAGQLLTRFGYANAIRAGNASLKGTIAWSGTPASIDYPSLSGDMQITAKDGQFKKLDPGAGRLLGILSLQALPRRMTLDFHDVFSEGFAFDNISGSMHIANGVMSTQDLEIRGPAAKVFMTGSTDLAHETHNLHVVVQPTLSESVAIGAAIVGTINPVVGVATYLAQKVLRDPVEKMFGFQYSITGSWADPKIDRLGGPGRLAPLSADAASEPQAGDSSNP